MMSVVDIMSTAEDVQHTGGYYDECGGYHEFIGGCSVHWGFHTSSIVFPMTFPHIYHDIPPSRVLMILCQCTEHPPVYS